MSAVEEGMDVDDLYQASAARMLTTAWMLLGSRHAAEDAVQEAFAKLAARDTSAVREPEAYLRTVVVNECRSVMRRRRHQAGDPVSDGIHLDRSDLEMREALARLSPRRRTVVVLRFYEDLKVDDIAALLGCRPGTVSSLLHRALKDLREVVDHDDER
ncbi:MAG TPA: sigma-70 family RNA polymerase sigma factor [Iamia sp.]|nr:sigma-70 family RNA polymerase sigma factor [Iamia sp.]